MLKTFKLFVDNYYGLVRATSKTYNNASFISFTLPQCCFTALIIDD